jgi:hypothetical protein
MTRIMLIVTAGLLAATLACGKEAAPTAKSAKPATPAASAPAAPAAAAPAAAPAGATAVAAINANCPMMGHAIEADAGTIDFKGHAIGFCCPKCIPKFEALDDAGKIAALDKNGTKLPE